MLYSSRFTKRHYVFIESCRIVSFRHIDIILSLVSKYLPTTHIIPGRNCFNVRDTHIIYCHLKLVVEVKFSYDLSPITVSYHQVSRNWYDYFTSLMAIIGGVFTVVGMMDTGLSSFSKKKSSHYY